MSKKAILERPGRKTTKTVRAVCRFPRLAESALPAHRPESAEDILKGERAGLETEAFEMIGNYRKMRVDLSRIFIRIKATLKQGGWEGCYAKTFGAPGVSFRSTERYMVRATKADAASKNDSLTIFKPGMGPEAQETRADTAEAQADIGDTPKPEPVYKLALHLSVDKRDATIRLWKSPHRRRAERKIVAVLDQLLIKFGALKGESADHDKEAR